MKNLEKIVVFWFRRDLRLTDNVALHHALNQDTPLLPLFIFDDHILNDLESKNDRRVDYIYQSLVQIQDELEQLQSSLKIIKGKPLEVFNALKKEFQIEAIYCNEDYETYGINRDLEISKSFNLISFKDHVIFRYDEILKKDHSAYKVFTPYSKQWKAKLKAKDYKDYTTDLSNLFKTKFDFPTLESLGFESTDLVFKKPSIPLDLLKTYKDNRDIPSLDATTKLGIALRFGTISTRECVRIAVKNKAETWLNELIWREFFMQILYYYPTSAYQAFKPKYDAVKWRNNPEEFKLWCKGETGYPIVDAGIKELNATGYMHNRVRMIVASFLCKHLLIDWRWGESYFASLLNDYELSSNVGNWQWASSTGCDATPYFRVFNPTLQQRKFDPDLIYIKQWIPDFDPENYITPIVDHDFARQRAIATYKEALNEF